MDAEVAREKAVAFIGHLVPLCLAGGVISMLGFRMYGNSSDDGHLKHFLFTSIVQMLPLVALKLKIWRAEDRLGILPRFAVKTMLMHVAFLLCRLPTYFVVERDFENLRFGVDLLALVLSLAILHCFFNFRWNKGAFSEHSDVRSIIFLALVATAGTEVLSEGMSFFNQTPAWNRRWLSSALMTAANYIDITSFVPIVWMMSRVESADDADGSTIGQGMTDDLRRQATFFFAFLVSFYFYEDVLDPTIHGYSHPMSMMANAGHFFLLVDFAGFFLFQVFKQQPAQLKGKADGDQLRGLLDEADIGDDFT